MGTTLRLERCHRCRRGDEHYSPTRCFPSCPVRLTYSPEEMKLANGTDQIERVLRQSLAAKAMFSYDTDWRSTGYVDLYYADWLVCSRSINVADVEYVTLAG